MTRRRRRLSHLTPRQLSARSRKAWIIRRAGWTPEQLAHHKVVYNTGLKKRLVRAGRCRSCCRKREPARRDVAECARCAKVSAARARRQPKRRYVARTQMRTAA